MWRAPDSDERFECRRLTDCLPAIVTTPYELRLSAERGSPLWFHPKTVGAATMPTYSGDWILCAADAGPSVARALRGVAEHLWT